jgi:broad specificity phosphatase PhoE
VDILFNSLFNDMKELTFNKWQDHLTKELKKDYKKLYQTSKFKPNENKFQKVSRRESADLHRV